MSVQKLSWGVMLKILGLDPSDSANASNASLALDIAAAMGIPVSPKNTSVVGWYYTENKAFAVRVKKR